MNMARRGLWFFLLVSVLVCVGFRRTPQALPRSEPVITRAIQIYLPSGGPWPVAVGADHAVFYIPVVGKGEMLGVIPVSNGHFVGIRVIPSMRDDNTSVRIEVSALVSAKRALSDANSSEIRSWQGEDAGSYVAKKDDVVELSGLGRFGLPVLKAKVIASSGLRVPSGDDHISCGCESTRDELNDYLGIVGAPEPGKCQAIGKCSRCCRALAP